MPARYEKVYARFSSGHWYGHVVAQVYVDGYGIKQMEPVPETSLEL
ncbi:hypothetical protein [Methanobacterium spitsbergense]